MKSVGCTFKNQNGWTTTPPPEMFADPISFIGKMQSPRVIKTHIPLELLPPKLVETCKVVYVCRNPKDTCVSYFHHSAIGKPVYKLYGNFEDYSELFFDGRLVYGDYWQHLKTAWALRGHENFKFIWFEDMKKDHKAGLKDLAQFLGYERTEEELDALVKHLTIDNMRDISVAKARNDYEKEFRSKFFRKGQVGDWCNYFQGEALQKWNQWIKRHLEGTDIVMTFK
ncbi:sulfotransferase 1B1-like [Tigriopus californicus]|uniref:sulfotransferase 1B1-like n=1 Tax=Tigriopus californicus TaxID=6832 RepID=UPI0027DA11E4|nr:sulfotransferase 1B1-like [Tigriopus californicus]